MIHILGKDFFFGGGGENSVILWLFKCEVDCLYESVLADSHHISKIKERIENNQHSEELKPRQYVSD